MRIWLFDILACPICKAWPLRLYIFSYDNQENLFKQLLENYLDTDSNIYQEGEIIEIYEEGTKISVKDNIVIQKTNFKEYLAKILESINELDNIIDKSPLKSSNEVLELAKTKVKQKIFNFSKQNSISSLVDIISELHFINFLKMEPEITAGLFFCDDCKRWYPIIEKIPRMLPDEYRDRDEDLEFLKNYKDLLDKELLNQDLKPFNF